MTRPPHDVKILFTEGSSLSARQSMTALGPLGYRIDVCDPNPRCLCRFSRYCNKLHQYPGMASDPEAYLDRILDLLSTGDYDVLLPTHEQAFLLSRVQGRVENLTGLTVPPFESIQRVQSKVDLALLLSQLGLPQPRYRTVASTDELLAHDAYPIYVKAAFSTAGRGVWRVTDVDQSRAVADELTRRNLWRWGVMIQSTASGKLCQAQAVFEHGQLVAAHCTTQRAVGVGGSQAARLSVAHSHMIRHLQTLGQDLSWHGALTLDYFWDDERDSAAIIECNPRLVEPMNAVMSGVNLAEMMVRLSLGESLAGSEPMVGQAGVRTHSVMSVLMGRAEQGGNRRHMLQVLYQALFRQGVFSDSREDLTPAGLDPRSLALPLAAAVALLLKPQLVHGIAGGTIAHYSVTPEAVEAIRHMTV